MNPRRSIALNAINQSSESNAIIAIVNSIAIKDVLKMQIKKPKNNQKDSQERRNHPRVAKNFAIKIKDKNTDFVTETMNISCLGAYCQVDNYIPVLTKLKINLLIPKSSKNRTAKHFTCEGTVVRVERCPDPIELNHYKIAIFFNQISKNDIKLISNYIKNHSAGHPEDTIK